MKKDIYLNQQLTFILPSQKTLELLAVNGIVAEDDGKDINVYLTLEVPFDTYQLIEKEQLFNLKPEVCSPLIDRQFDPYTNLTLELMLKPGLLPQLTQDETTTATLINHLQQPPGPEPLPHQFTENWFCLGVRQQQLDKTIAYRTLWDWANPDTLAQLVATGKDTFQQLGAQIKTALSTGSQALEEISRELGAPPTGDSDSSISAPISQIMAAFFNQDDWDYVSLDEGATLEMAFIGDNGRWSCSAQARDEEQQFLFYSICPLTIPAPKRSAIAELLTKANSGLILGNFELDYSDGEVCYKTSIDVEGDRLTPALVESLVYTNVTMMDQYLPGIIAVLNGTSPDNAIAQVEAE
ncbi:YbjN domain-containing protein [Arthrospira platensis]|uniref:YbjN domain-containing protein n=1 Tax=Limnospira TaxID=2596745 RepID=UPI000291D209|nr:YbjN domain-containing protein [Arthrospira platensis]AMW31388.1 hypothetical protein AP285_29195 [Arthrospira platensis YZ]KDR56121.1 hypothetical protein APPUASWS_018500 [Arthrospira platensis str. Paraca]MBD2668989.1 YbjN domain-containing protein [Arthrospira platensis FACHB-439]MBD2709426.1 YbjN domain-containing protein [Arthrospira platensis FACHB-835]MDT9182083.1 YbjN domain-containing protein [Limnospira sp. PMC 289.06]MDT9294227.1 YbjN domain-containing protein [Arthrospira plate